MIELIIKMIFLDVLWVLLWKIGTSKGMIFEKIGTFGEKKIEQGYKIFDGLTECEWCLGNIHGIVIVWPLAFLLGIIPFEWNYKYLIVHVFMVGGTSFIAGVSWALYKHLELKHKYLEHLEEQEHFNLKERKQSYFKSKNKQS